MVKVDYKINEGNEIIYLSIKGHADSYVVDNKDLVCAIVSTITIGGLNEIKDDHNYKMSVKDGDIEVKVLTPNNYDNVVLKTILTQLETLESKYKKNITIKCE